MAVVSSFLGVTLRLFAYLEDQLGFDDSRLGRLTTACVTFAPPTLDGVLPAGGAEPPAGLPLGVRPGVPSPARE